MKEDFDKLCDFTQIMQFRTISTGVRISGIGITVLIHKDVSVWILLCGWIFDIQTRFSVYTEITFLHAAFRKIYIHQGKVTMTISFHSTHLSSKNCFFVKFQCFQFTYKVIIGAGVCVSSPDADTLSVKVALPSSSVTDVTSDESA